MTGFRTEIGCPAESVKLTVNVPNGLQFKVVGLDIAHEAPRAVVVVPPDSIHSPLVAAGNAGVKNVLGPAISVVLLRPPAFMLSVPVKAIFTRTPDGVDLLAVCPPTTPTQVFAASAGIW